MTSWPTWPRAHPWGRPLRRPSTGVGGTRPRRPSSSAGSVNGSRAACSGPWRRASFYRPDAGRAGAPAPKGRRRSGFSAGENGGPEGGGAPPSGCGSSGSRQDEHGFVAPVVDLADHLRAVTSLPEHHHVVWGRPLFLLERGLGLEDDLAALGDRELGLVALRRPGQRVVPGDERLSLDGSC